MEGSRHRDGDGGLEAHGGRLDDPLTWALASSSDPLRARAASTSVLIAASGSRSTASRTHLTSELGGGLAHRPGSPSGVQSPRPRGSSAAGAAWTSGPKRAATGDSASPASQVALYNAMDIVGATSGISCGTAELLEQELLDLRRRVRLLTAEKDDLQDENDRLRRAADEERRRTDLLAPASWERQRIELQEENASLKRRRDALEREVSLLRESAAADVDRTSYTHKATEDKIRKLESQLAVTEDRAADAEQLERELAEVRRQLRKAEDEAEQLRADEEGHRASERRLRKRLDEVESQVEAQNATNQKLQLDADLLTRRVAELKALLGSEAEHHARLSASHAERMRRSEEQMKLDTERIASLEVDNEQLTAALRKVQESNHVLGQENQDLVKVHSEWVREKSQLHSALQETARHSDELKRDVDMLRAENDTLRRQLEEALAAQADRHSHEIKEYRERVLKLESQLNQAPRPAAVEALEKRIRLVEEERAWLVEGNEKLRKQEEEARRRDRVSRSELETAKAAAEEDARHWMRQHADLKRRQDALEAEAERNAALVQTYRDKIHSLEDQHKVDAEKALRQEILEQKASELTRQFRELREEQDMLLKENESLRRGTESLRQHEKRLRAEIQQVQTDKEELELQMQALQRGRASLEAQVLECRDTALAEVASTKANADKALKHQGQLLSDMEAQLSKAHLAEQQNAVLRREIRELEAEREAWALEKDRLRHFEDKLRQDVEHLKAAAQERLESERSLMEAHRKEREECQKLRTELAQVREEADRWRRQLARLEQAGAREAEEWEMLRTERELVLREPTTVVAEGNPPAGTVATLAIPTSRKALVTPRGASKVTVDLSSGMQL